jgi:hypothetical protein
MEDLLPAEAQQEQLIAHMAAVSDEASGGRFYTAIVEKL